MGLIKRIKLTYIIDKMYNLTNVFNLAIPVEQLYDGRRRGRQRKTGRD